MRTRAHIAIRLLVGTASLGLVGCQGGDLTLPADVSPASLEVVDGNGQVGTVGTQLPKPLVVRVVDEADEPLPNISLRFKTEVPAAIIDPPVVTTNDTGVAAVEVQLGSTEGVQIVEASLADAGGLKTTFALIAEASQPPGDRDGDDDDDGGGRGRGRGNGNGGDDDD